MATANEILFDESVAHQIDLQGYSNGVTGRIIQLLNRVDADLMQQIAVAIEQMPPNQFNIERLERLLVSVRALNGRTFADISAELETELKSLTAYEAGYQQQLLTSVLPSQVAINAVNINQVYAAAMARPFQGKLLREWLDGVEAGRAASIRDAIRIGYVESQTTSEIVRRIRGTKALNYADGLLNTTRRGIESIVLTAVNHTANYANDALIEANSDVIKGYRYSATLDLGTTTICASRDGNVYPIGQPKPAIPAHIRCRSRYVGVLKSWRELGLDVDQITGQTRASLDGQVPRETTYNEWLKRQSIERQNEVLGVDKAKLFRDGGLSLDKFVSKQGHVYTLDELRKRDKEAFAKAGLKV